MTGTLLCIAALSASWVYSATSLRFSVSQFLPLVVQRFGEGEIGLQPGFVGLFSQEFQYTVPEELSGVCRSEGNKCSIDCQRHSPAGRTPLDCTHKGPSGFSLVYMLKITSLDSPKFQKLAKWRRGKAKEATVDLQLWLAMAWALGRPDIKRNDGRRNGLQYSDA